MNWYELKWCCIDHVARELARPHVGAEVKRTGEPSLLVWARLQSAMQDDAVKSINDMSNLALIDLISEVAGSSET